MKRNRILVDKVTCRAGHTVERDRRKRGDTYFLSDIVTHYMFQHKLGFNRAMDAAADLVAKAELAL